MNYNEIIRKLKSKRNPRNIAGMARFGINPKNMLGISIPTLRALAKQIGTDHALALKLWASGIHEARILASIVDEPARVTQAQMERWVRDFDSWDVCDQVCGNLFWQMPLASRQAIEWSKREPEFQKRAGFALMAYLAHRHKTVDGRNRLAARSNRRSSNQRVAQDFCVDARAWHDRDARDAAFEKFLPAIVRGARDERNFVKKAVNWALRQIGKRNARLNRAAIRTAREIARLDSKSARWVAADALRELNSPAVQKKILKGQRG